MYKIDDDTLYNLLINPKNGVRHHYVADCPICGKEKHFYIKRETDEVDLQGRNRSFKWHCKKCGETGGLYKLLQILGRIDLVSFGRLIDVFKEEVNLNIIQLHKQLSITEIPEIPNKSLPPGYKRIFDHDYLTNDRGFEEQDYITYEVGEAKVLSKNKDYLYFPIKMDKQVKGYIGRSKYSKKEEKYLKSQGVEVLRYNNSSMTDFGALLYGYDEIIPNKTQIVILVEGLFDKINVDKKLNLRESCQIKCVCTFGKKISEIQTLLLKNKNVAVVIVFYDPIDAVNDSKKYAEQLSFFFIVKVAYTLKLNEQKEIKDPGELTQEEMIEVMDTLQDPFAFHISKVNTKILKI